MNITETETDGIHPPERIFNTLPIGFNSWLEFYDWIPNWIRITEELQITIKTSREKFVKYFGREPQYAGEHFMLCYEMKRDFLLARCAEQMLSVRFSYEALLKMQTEFLCTAPEPDYLEPLFESAIAVSKKGKRSFE